MDTGPSDFVFLTYIDRFLTPSAQGFLCIGGRGVNFLREGDVLGLETLSPFQPPESCWHQVGVPEISVGLIDLLLALSPSLDISGNLLSPPSAWNCFTVVS